MSRVLVTGGASGLGAALAAAFLARGDEVLIVDVNQPAGGGFETVADAPSSTTEGTVVQERGTSVSKPPPQTTEGAVVEERGTSVSTPPAQTTEGAVVEERGASVSTPPAQTTEGAVVQDRGTGVSTPPPQTTGGTVVEERGTSVSKPPPRSAFMHLDVRSDEDWAAARDWVEREWGGLDVLVNNAGVAGGGRIDVAGMDEWQWITEINLFGVVRGTRTFAPMFKQQRSGHVVNIASLAGLVHPAGMGSYNAVKAAVVAFSETMGHELAEYDVRCSVVCPSYFRTRLIENMQGTDTAVGQVVGGLVASAPLGPEDIAAAVLDGMDRGEELIIPDDAARAAYELKLKDRAAYDRVMRKQAQRLNAMSEGGEAG